MPWRLLRHGTRRRRSGKAETTLFFFSLVQVSLVAIPWVACALSPLSSFRLFLRGSIAQVQRRAWCSGHEEARLEDVELLHPTAAITNIDSSCVFALGERAGGWRTTAAKQAHADQHSRQRRTIDWPRVAAVRARRARRLRAASTMLHCGSSQQEKLAVVRLDHLQPKPRKAQQPY